MPDPIGVGGATTSFVDTADQAPDVDDVKFDGKIQGEKVVLENHAESMVNKAAEHSTRTHHASKSLSERMATGAGAAALAKLIAQYRKVLPDLPPVEKFDEFFNDCRKQDTPPEEIRRLVEEQFPEVAHQHAALAFLEHALTNDRGRSKEDDELLKNVRLAQKQLEEEAGPEIRAALNVSAHAAERPDLGTVAELRDFYRQSVVGYTTLGQAYDSIMSRYGPERFGEAVDFLITSLGRDVSAHEPSRETAELKATLDDLYFVQVARNSVENIRGLLGKMAKSFGVESPMDPHSVLKDVLALKDQRFIDPERVQTLTDRIGVREPEARIYFQRELHTLVRRMPDKIFANADERFKLADAVQSALDRSIEQEGL